MELDANCILCLLRRQTALAEAQGEPEKTCRYLYEVMDLLGRAPRGVAAPYLIPQFDDAFARYWPEAGDVYAAVKEASNAAMLRRLPWMRRAVEAAADPVDAALRLAVAANYIDYGTLAGAVELERLDTLLAEALETPLDEAVSRRLREDLAHARRLLYLGDNAGEIVADRVLIEQLRRRYPDLAVTYAVRGGAALNDVTRADAAAVAMEEVAAVVDNGTRIPGTELPYIGPALREALDGADVLLAKGQANFETLAGCGKNLYYIFLCKCERFVRMFGVPMLTPLFLREQALELASPYV